MFAAGPLAHQPTSQQCQTSPAGSSPFGGPNLFCVALAHRNTYLINKDCHVLQMRV